MAELIEVKLSDAGLKRYEISNYARPGQHSRHNVNYWRGGDYLGLGAGAHSYRRNSDGVSGQRWSNEKNPAKYMTQVSETHLAIVDREAIEREKAAAEFMFLGLRMTEGISSGNFRRRFGQTPIGILPADQIMDRRRIIGGANRIPAFHAQRASACQFDLCAFHVGLMVNQIDGPRRTRSLAEKSWRTLWQTIASTKFASIISAAWFVRQN